MGLTTPNNEATSRLTRVLSRCLMLLLPFSGAASAQVVSRDAVVETHSAASTVPAMRLSGTVAIDGKVSEESWQAIPVYSDFKQREPEEGQAPTERTEVRVAYDDDALYVAVRLFDTDPAGIMRRLSRRDEVANADLVTIYLDPYHDHVSGVMFEVSAAGVQRDAQIYDDYERDSQWDAVWLSAVAVDEQGWSAELKIPFSQIRFVSAPSQIWGINVSRNIYRKNERDWLELVPRNAPFLASRMAHLTGLEGIKPRSRIELLPYGTLRTDLVSAEPGDPFRDGQDTFSNAGLDTRWGITSNLTLDATVNPDFGQVEVDPSVVNLTEFESFFSEKRPFFLEGAQTFQTSAEDQAFYSRRIGRAPQGYADGEFVNSPSSTTILGAAKLTGRTASGWSLGLLNALTSRENAEVYGDRLFGKTEVEPLTNYMVARVLKEGDRGGLGSLLTATNRNLRTDSLGGTLSRQAYVAAADGYVYLDNSRDWIVRGETAASWLEGSSAALLEQQTSSRRYYQRPDATHVELDPEATTLGGWRGSLAAERQSGTWKVGADATAISPGFESNDLGFQSRADRASANAEFSLGHFETDRWTRERKIELSKAYAWNFGGDRQQDSWEVSASATFLNYWQLEGSVGTSRQTLDDHLTRGGPLALAPASYWSNIEFESDDRKAVTVSAGWSHNWDDAGGWSHDIGLEINVKPTDRLEISAAPYFSRGRDIAQHIDEFEDPLATNTFGTRYVFGEIDQDGASMITKVNFTLNPKLTFQFYAEPFFATGLYSSFKELAEPRTFDFSTFGVDSGTIAFDEEENEYIVDPDGAGPAASFSFDNEDFNERSLVAKAVVRWEWRLGSTFYFVWSQQRSDESDLGRFAFGPNARALLRAPADDVFMVKLSYWFSR